MFDGRGGDRRELFQLGAVVDKLSFAHFSILTTNWVAVNGKRVSGKFVYYNLPLTRLPLF
jgi:hypothetical protein